MPPINPPKSGSTRPILIGVVCLALVVAVLLGLRSNSMSKLEPFPAAAYLEKPGDFLGNTYSLRAQIDSQIKWQKGAGRILAVRPEVASARLPVFVPESVGGNIQPGQRFEMQVQIQEGGIYVEDLRKY